MEQITITAKIQIVATETDKVLLDETMSVYRNACNYVSDYVFHTHDLKQFILLYGKSLVLNRKWLSLFLRLLSQDIRPFWRIKTNGSNPRSKSLSMIWSGTEIIP